MDINELTIGQAKQLAELFGSNNNTACEKHPYEVGKAYLVRTVTFIYTGRLLEVTKNELVMEDVAWIADTGRWADMLKDASKLNEVEPYPEGKVIIGRGGIMDAVEWKNDLPKSQK